MIVFFDPKSGRGGGQVVLEKLLADLAPERDLALVMPQAGADAVAVPREVAHLISSRALDDVLPPRSAVTLVSNAHASLPDLVRTARRLRRAGRPVRTVAILHNYPMVRAKRVLTIALLRQVDLPIVVEPGLLELCPRAVVPSWLGVQDGSRATELAGSTVARTGRVKSYGRPDKSKGLHLLPATFGALEGAGYQCEVALGQALQQQSGYRDRLACDLAPWLVDGPRGPDWIEPGDIFLVPSIGGEAACLSAQEALSNGAFVVASRLGLMPYLSPTREGIRTFAVGDTAGATTAIREALALSDEAFSAEIRASLHAMSQRAGRWYVETEQLICAVSDASTAAGSWRGCAPP